MKKVYVFINNKNEIKVGYGKEKSIFSNILLRLGLVKLYKQIPASLDGKYPVNIAIEISGKSTEFPSSQQDASGGKG